MTRRLHLALLASAVLIAAGAPAATAAVPVNSGLPSISPTGTVAVGTTLTCDHGTWDTATSYTYAWRRDSDTLAETSATYTTVAADRQHTMMCFVTAHNADGPSQPEPSFMTAFVAVAPSITVTSRPASEITTTTASVAYTNHYQTTITGCTLDGAPLSSCASPITVTGLTDGEHVIRITGQNWASETVVEAVAFTYVDPRRPALSVTGPGKTYVGEQVSFSINTDGSSVVCTLDGAPVTCDAAGGSMTMPAEPGDHTLVVVATGAAGLKTSSTTMVGSVALPDPSTFFPGAVGTQMGLAIGLPPSLPDGWHTDCRGMGFKLFEFLGVWTGYLPNSLGSALCIDDRPPLKFDNGAFRGTVIASDGLVLSLTQFGAAWLDIPVVRNNLRLVARVLVYTTWPATPPAYAVMGGVTVSGGPLTCPTPAAPKTTKGGSKPNLLSAEYAWYVNDVLLLTSSTAQLTAVSVPKNGVVSCTASAIYAPGYHNVLSTTTLIDRGVRVGASLGAGGASAAATGKKSKKGKKIAVRLNASGKKKLDVSVFRVSQTGSGATAKYKYKRVFRKRVTVKRGRSKVAVRPKIKGRYKVVISVVGKKGKLGRSIALIG